MKLIDAPIGLFKYNRTLCLKTEYSTIHSTQENQPIVTPDCYIIESGKYFWGGASSVKERNNLNVYPIDINTICIEESEED